MAPLDEAEAIVSQWNETHTDYVPWVRVKACTLAYSDWQEAIAKDRPPGEVTAHLIRHHDFARWIPDELLLLLMDDEDLCGIAN